MKYGSPQNLKEPLLFDQPGKFYNYYWNQVEVDTLLTGKKLKGNLIATFQQESVQGPKRLGTPAFRLISHQDVFMGWITGDDFKAVLETLAGRWKIISKTTHTNSSRTYDLYQLSSNDQLYEAEISYSPPGSIVDPPRPSPQVPLFNFWIHIAPKGR
ncbi:MAG: hypothetical protein HY036_01970 [Nitrospirae bacterium]|nr:hypothetical protein [Nitrospirota bacterium]MBI3351324.1 hypothetical protein [Nitrospirota bacterium]